MSEVGSLTVTSFVIRELTGDERALTLKTRALPYRPLELSGTQRNSVEWYPGSPIGTLQVYGAKEEPTTISGQWKDKFLFSPLIENAPATVSSASAESTEFGDAISVREQGIQTARDLVNLVDDMRRKGQEVEVTWLDQARRGIIDRFTVRWFTGHDCEWEIMFTWISQAESLEDIVFLDNVTGLADLPSKVQSELDILYTGIGEEQVSGVQGDSGVPELSILPQASTRASDALVSLTLLVGDLQEFTDQLTDAVVAAAGSITQFDEVIQRVTGVLDGIKLKAELLVELTEETADGIALDSGALSSINETVQTFGEVLATRAAIRDQAVTAVGLRNLAAREQSALLKRLTSTVIKVFQARENQDLREISQTFYGTPDEWRSLMVFNNLTSSGLSAGQVVFVPAQPSTGRLC